MRFDSRFLPRLSTALLLLAATSAVAAPARETQPGEVPAQAQQAAPVPADPKAVPVNPEAGAFQYGPINAQDPAVRNQIKKLYRDQAELEKATQDRLAELATTLQNESDPDFRLQIQRDMIQAKKDLQLQSMELGLEIARLNEDTRRVADYEKALDQLRNPEKYLPATLDPSIAHERARQMGLEN